MNWMIAWSAALCLRECPSKLLHVSMKMKITFLFCPWDIDQTILSEEGFSVEHSFDPTGDCATEPVHPSDQRVYLTMFCQTALPIGFAAAMMILNNSVQEKKKCFNMFLFSFFFFLLLKQFIYFLMYFFFPKDEFQTICWAIRKHIIFLQWDLLLRN